MLPWVGDAGLVEQWARLAEFGGVQTNHISVFGICTDMKVGESSWQ